MNHWCKRRWVHTHTHASVPTSTQRFNPPRTSTHHCWKVGIREDSTSCGRCARRNRARHASSCGTAAAAAAASAMSASSASTSAVPRMRTSTARAWAGWPRSIKEAGESVGGCTRGRRRGKFGAHWRGLGVAVTGAALVHPAAAHTGTQRAAQGQQQQATEGEQRGSTRAPGRQPRGLSS